MLRSWAGANPDVMVRYIQAYVEGLRYALAPDNRAESIKRLIDNIKLPSDIAAQPTTWRLIRLRDWPGMANSTSKASRTCSSYAQKPKDWR